MASAGTPTTTTNKKTKMGRPSIYTQKLADQICEYIEDGKSLRAIAELKNMPNRSTLRAWLRDYPDFSAQYARAKAEQAELFADSIAEIAAQTLQGVYDPNAARVAVEALKWTASKLKPRKYGDKLDLTSGGAALPTPIIAVGMGPATVSNVTHDIKALDEGDDDVENPAVI